jgi:hypothetical protein
VLLDEGQICAESLEICRTRKTARYLALDATATFLRRPGRAPPNQSLSCKARQILRGIPKACSRSRLEECMRTAATCMLLPPLDDLLTGSTVKQQRAPRLSDRDGVPKCRPFMIRQARAPTQARAEWLTPPWWGGAGDEVWRDASSRVSEDLRDDRARRRPARRRSTYQR